MGHLGSMKIKTSFTLSEDLLKVIDQRSRQYKNRSEFIETALLFFIAHRRSSISFNRFSRMLDMSVNPSPFYLCIINIPELAGGLYEKIIFFNVKCIIMFSF